MYSGVLAAILIPKMNSNIAAILLGLVFMSCSSSRVEKRTSGHQGSMNLVYLLSWRNRGHLDTIYMEKIHEIRSDSFNTLKYTVDWDQRNDSPYEQEFKLPNFQDSVGPVRLVLEKTFVFEDKEYAIRRYQLDERNSEDEESLYFYSQVYGIILFHWGSWRNSQRLIRTGNVEDDRIIYFLTDKIESDCELTKDWN